uniref:Uncharacterized protein n=1 Tax=Rhizophora mucronata TaxID=61149 RepID=A0A2P2JK35_RHIMU
MLLLKLLASRFKTIKFFNDIKSWTFGGLLREL